MKNLTRDAFKRAKAFIHTTDRPLEEALFTAFIENSSPAWALQELAAFQNVGCGFGRGLEPDLQLEDSSVLATTVALQTLRKLGISSSHELVQGAMRYLINTYHEDAHAWPIIPANSDDAPHAPWWQYDPDLSRYLSNPRAEIVGYLFDYWELVPENLGETLLSAVLEHLAIMQGEIEMHDLLCYLRLLETKTLPEASRDILVAQLQPAVDKAVAKDAAAWNQYGLKPLWVAPTPDSYFAGFLEKAIEDNLDYEIENQAPDGSWGPAWSWGDSYPEAWPHAQRAWKGVLTVNTLHMLSAYGRIAN